MPLPPSQRIQRKINRLVSHDTTFAEVSLFLNMLVKLLETGLKTLKDDDLEALVRKTKQILVQIKALLYLRAVSGNAEQKAELINKIDELMSKVKPDRTALRSIIKQIRKIVRDLEH